MAIKNRLKEILEELGFRIMVPTDQVLASKLGGMTLIRFNKLLNNAGNEMRLHEEQLLTAWLSELTGKPKANIKILPKKKEPAC